MFEGFRAVSSGAGGCLRSLWRMTSCTPSVTKASLSGPASPSPGGSMTSYWGGLVVSSVVCLSV